MFSVVIKAWTKDTYIPQNLQCDVPSPKLGGQPHFFKGTATVNFSHYVLMLENYVLNILEKITE